eukprot:TCONS_00012887-protein
MTRTSASKYTTQLLWLLLLSTFTFAENTLPVLCHRAGITNSTCQCQDFIVNQNNVTASLCTILHTNPQASTLNITSLENTHLLPGLAVNYCSFFNMTQSECNCRSVRIISRNKVLDNCRTPRTTELPVTAHLIRDVYDLCDLFGIAHQNCSCDLFTGTDVCSFVKPKFVRRINMHDYQRVYAIFAAVTAFVGIFGNSLVICVSESSRKRKTGNLNKLIRLLAFYDLIFAIFQFVNVVPKFWTPKWLYGPFLCSLFKSVESISAMLAVGVILAISIERYLKLFHPNFDITPIKLHSFLAVNFIFAIAGISPLLAHFQLDQELQICKIQWPLAHSEGTVYQGVTFILYYVIPIILIGALYTKIIRYLNRLNARPIIRTASDLVYQVSHQKENKRIINSMVSVVFVFILFVFPKHIVTLYFNIKGWSNYVSGKDLSVDAYFALMYLAHIPYLFHICANPLIYSITDSRWRHEFKRFVMTVKAGGRKATGKFTKNQHSSIDLTNLTSVDHGV